MQKLNTDVTINSPVLLLYLKRYKGVIIIGICIHSNIDSKILKPMLMHMLQVLLGLNSTIGLA